MDLNIDRDRNFETRVIEIFEDGKFPALTPTSDRRVQTHHGRSQSKCVTRTDNLLTSPGIFCRVSSVVFNACVLFLSDTFPKGTVIPMCSLCSEFDVTLVVSRTEEAFIDLTAHSILGVLLQSIAVKIVSRVISPTFSIRLPIFQSIQSLKHLSKFFTSSKFSLVVELLPVVSMVNFWSAVHSLTTSL